MCKAIIHSEGKNERNCAIVGHFNNVCPSHYRKLMVQINHPTALKFYGSGKGKFYCDICQDNHIGVYYYFDIYLTKTSKLPVNVCSKCYKLFPTFGDCRWRELK